jgi:hypothetical protein
MKILIDIGHPAHVHYFRNFIRIMKEKDHIFFVTARQKEIAQDLLNYYNIEYQTRGSGGSSFISKLFYMLKADWLLIKYARKFDPDLFMSFASPYAAQASFILGKPHVALDDTEHAILGQAMYVPFTKHILSPRGFRKNFGKRHIYFNGTTDNAYLHPNYFLPDIAYLKELGLYEEKYFVVRFVSYEAVHDRDVKSISANEKYEIIDLLNKFGKVIISSESILPDKLEKFRYSGNIGKIHTILSGAALFIGESGTMATEASVLGTYSILLNPVVNEDDGIIRFLSKFGNISLAQDFKSALDLLNMKLQISDLKQQSQKNAQHYFENTVDLTDLLVTFVENLFPEK